MTSFVPRDRPTAAAGFGCFRSCVLVALLVSPMFAPSADANVEVYRWVDEKGRVNYGDKPPAGQAFKAERPVTSRPTSPTASAGAPQDPVVAKRRAEVCAQARAQLAYLNASKVAKPVDNPQRALSRELDQEYRSRLAAYVRYKASRERQFKAIWDNCR